MDNDSCPNILHTYQPSRYVFYYFFVCFSRLQRHRQVYVFTYEIRRIIGRFMYLVLTINYIDHEFSLTVV